MTCNRGYVRGDADAGSETTPVPGTAGLPARAWGCGGGAAMEDPVQDEVAPPAAPGAGKSKLETLPKEDLIKFAKKQMMLIQKANSRCTGID